MKEKSTVARRVIRGVAEFLIIVVGVMVALAGDSWLEGREEAARAEVAVALLLENLDDDAESLEAVAQYPLMHDSVRATIWSTPVDRAVPQDSIPTLIRRLIFGTDFRPARAAYESLLASDGLRHVGDQPIRNQIVEYYEEYLSEVVTWYEWWIQFNAVFFEMTTRMQVPDIHELGQGLGPWQEVPQRSTRSWSQFRGDEQLMSHLWLVSIYEQGLERRVREALSANQALRVRLESIQ